MKAEIKPEIVIGTGHTGHAGEGKSNHVAKGFAEALARATGQGRTTAPAVRGAAPRESAPAPAANVAAPRVPATPASKPAQTAIPLLITGKAPPLRQGKLAVVADRPTPRSARGKGESGKVEKEKDKAATPRAPQLLPTAHGPLPGEPAPAPVTGKAVGKDKHPVPVEAAKPKTLAEAERPEAPLPAVEKKAVPIDHAARPATPFTLSDAPMVAPPVAAPAAAAPILQQAAEDPGLRVAVLSHTANVAIEGSDGNLALHVRVRDGAADVRIGGTMAPLFDNRAP
jgi:hypothetical protein